VIALLHILCHGKSGSPYNVGSDQAISIKELAAIVAACFKPIATIEFAHTNISSLKPERYIPCIDYLRQDLMLNKQINLHDAIQKTIFWHQQKKITPS
jgi:dTDP-glucose 4,6-dehydratase